MQQVLRLTSGRATVGASASTRFIGKADSPGVKRVLREFAGSSATRLYCSKKDSGGSSEITTKAGSISDLLTR